MHRIGFVLFPGANILSTAPVSVFEVANFSAGKPFYELQILSETGGPVRTSWGITVETQAFGEPDFDTLLIGAGTEIEVGSPKLLKFIEKGAAVLRENLQLVEGLTRAKVRHLECRDGRGTQDIGARKEHEPDAVHGDSKMS